MSNQVQNQPAASLAAVLGPLLQQTGGLQNLQGLLSGQIQANPAQQAPQNNLNPGAQLGVIDQVPFNSCTGPDLDIAMAWKCCVTQ